jgi:hypothetical protein
MEKVKMEDPKLAATESKLEAQIKSVDMVGSHCVGPVLLDAC